MYIYIYKAKLKNELIVCHVQMSKYMHKKPRHLFIQKIYFGFFQNFKDSIK